MEEPEGGVSSNPLAKCALCSTSVFKLNQDPLQLDRGEDFCQLSLEKCVQAYFVLRHVLETPLDKVEDLLRLSGDKREGWMISLCLSCTDKVEGLRKAYKEMVVSRRRFEELRRQLRMEVAKKGDLEGSGSKIEVTAEEPECPPDDFNVVDGDEGTEDDGVGAEGAELKEEQVSEEEDARDFEGCGLMDGEEDVVDSDSMQGEGEGDGGDLVEDDEDYPDKKVKKFCCDVEGCPDNRSKRNKDLNAFLAHYNFHEDLTVKCSSCTRLFTSTLGIRNHWKTFHKELHNSVIGAARYSHVAPIYPKIPWWCPVCPFENKFWSEDERNEHLKTEHPDKIQPADFFYACNKCQKRYPSVLELKLHKGTFHDMKSANTFKCNQCLEMFRTKFQLDNHQKQSHNPNKSSKKAKSHPIAKKAERKMLNCDQDQCSEAFRTEFQLLMHRRRIHRLDLLKCSECSREFILENNLTIHLQKGHNTTTCSKFPCEYCGKIFPLPGILNRHISQTHEKETCTHCGLSISKPYLQSHLFLKHGIGTCKMYCCPVDNCKAEYTVKGNLRIHRMQKHSSSPQYECSHCGKLFYTPSHRNRHEKNQHAKELKHKCGFCGKGFARLDNMKTHEKYHQPGKRLKGFNRCLECGEVFTQMKLLARHKRKFHEQPEPKMPKGTKSKPRNPESSQKVIPKSPKKERPKQTRKKPEIKLKPPRLPPSESVPAVCHLCGRTLKSKLILHYHIKKVHEKLEKSCCDQCGKELSSRNALRVHQALVHKIGWNKHYQAKISCPVEGCTRKMINQRLLDLHMTQHSQNPQFKCGDCGKEFYFREKLQSHARSWCFLSLEKYLCHIMAQLIKLQHLGLGLFLGILGLAHGSVEIQRSIDPADQKLIDDFITKLYLPASNVSKLGLSIVKNNGEVVYSTGFGMADHEKGIPNSNQTQFLIGSTTKSFTATIVVRTLHELFPELGESVLDTPIRKLVPSANFTLIDRFRSEYATFRDLLAHRMCIFNHVLTAEPFNTTSEIFYRERYAEQICGMRTEFQYNNQMYVIAGELAGILANKSYTELMNTLLKDIGMHNSSLIDISDDFSNMPFIAQPYYVMNNATHPINTELIKRVYINNAAGGLYATPDDMEKYMRFHLNKGNVDGKQIIPEEVMKWLTKPANVMPAMSYKSLDADLVANTFGYGLGLMLAAYDGWEYIHHGGYFPPYRSLMSLFPSQKLGIFTSGNEGPALIDPVILHAYIFEVLRGTSDANATEKITRFWDVQKAIKEEKIRKKEKVLTKFLEEHTSKRSANAEIVHANEIVGKYGSGASGDVEVLEKFNNQTNTTQLYVKYGKWSHGYMENIGGSVYQITWDTDIVQDNYASGDATGLSYATVENETLAFVVPVGEELVTTGKFKLGVSLDILPPIPWAPDSCGPESKQG